jgi:hypothetical protein
MRGCFCDGLSLPLRVLCVYIAGMAKAASDLLLRTRSHTRRQGDSSHVDPSGSERNIGRGVRPW